MCKYMKILGIGHMQTGYIKFSLRLYVFKYHMSLTILLKCFMMIGCESVTNKQTHFRLHKDLPDKVGRST
jgi:hypothetical protein